MRFPPFPPPGGWREYDLVEPGPLTALDDLDVSSWPEEGPESRGKRPKFWVRAPDGSVWLRKEPRESRPFERVIETTVLRIARAVGMRAPRSQLCHWAAGGPERVGVVVKRFIARSMTAPEELALGVDVLRGTDPGYDPENKSHHTLERTRSALFELERLQAGKLLLKRFAEMVLFDAWIGNTDRHQENWGVLRSGAGIRLAPVFDTAACLGAELTDGAGPLGDTSDVRLQNYIRKCNSGFGDGKTLITQEQVVEEMRAWPEWTQASAEWIPRFEKGLVEYVPPYLAATSETLLPPDRKALLVRLLTARLAWLRRRTLSL